MTQSEPRPEERQSPAIRDVSAPEFAWRVLRLVNVYRILVSVFLLAMFLIADDPRLIGAVQPDLFFATALAYFVFGAMNDFAVTQRWPSLMSQSVVQILVDVVAIMVLTHASGGLDSGLGNLLIVSVGAVSLIWARRRAGQDVTGLVHHSDRGVQYRAIRYTERLADEMGLYSGDLERMGVLSFDSWRAGRLVVDTGIHALGWSKQEAIDYLVRNSPQALNNIETEVERYIGMPGQALAYMIGRREIVKLRTDAERNMGAGFDIKGFHDTVLGSGPVPLGILRNLVEDWANAAP